MISSDDLCRRLRLYLVIDPSMSLREPLDVAMSGIRGGVTAIQLRSKTLTDRETLLLARKLVDLCVTHDVLFIVNDRVDIALACGASGVHLGIDDLPLTDARRVGGADFVIGYSPETDEQTSAARGKGADYLGVGPVYGTASKSDAGPAIGLERLAARQRSSGLPTVGIGGITAANAADVLRAGACGVAVVSAITQSPDPEMAARTLAMRLAGAAS